MNIQEVLSLIAELVKRNNLSGSFIVGGVPRDKLLGRLKTVEDIDITSGDESIHKLSELLSKETGGSYKKFPDGHSHVIIDSIKFDFSSNYYDPQVKPLLAKAGVKNPSNLQVELYSRDFTVNCLLMTLDLKDIKDPLGLGINDIKARRIRTPIPAKFTLGNDHKRIVRVIYLAAKLGMEVDDEIIEWVKANKQYFSDTKSKYLSTKLNQAINYDKDKTIELLNKMDLWQYVPPLPALSKYVGVAG